MKGGQMSENTVQTIQRLADTSHDAETATELRQVLTRLIAASKLPCGYVQGDLTLCARTATKTLKYKSRSMGFNWSIELHLCTEHVGEAYMLDDPVTINLVRFPLGDVERCEPMLRSENSDGNSQKENGLLPVIADH